MNELELRKRLKEWLISNHFKKSELLIEEDAILRLEINNKLFKVDLVVIQSKSNVIHAFEIKTQIKQNSVTSIIWQIESLYGNYKWLVIPKSILPIKEIQKNIKEKGLGLIVYLPDKNDFRIIVKPRYIDGNLIEYYPSIYEKWTNKNKRYGSHSRTKNKN